MNKKLILLIAEDDDIHFLLTKKALLSWGVNSPIVRFANGRAILDFLHTAKQSECLADKIFILLLDINLPEVDGLEVLRQIKQNDQLKHLPVIILTSADDTLTANRCHSLGCSAFFTKPLKRDDFFAMLKKLDINLPVSKPLEKI